MNIPYLDLKATNALFEPLLSEAIGRTVRSGRYLQGEETARFEAAFARFCGARHCVGVGNGLDAITLILLAMKQLEGWHEGDEIVVPAFTFIASAEAVSRAGLTPVLCDIAADDFLIDLWKTAPRPTAPSITDDGRAAWATRPPSASTPEKTWARWATGEPSSQATKSWPDG